MDPNRKQSKLVLVGTLVVLISVLHLTTQISRHHYHVFYRELYFVPVILAAFWFGLRGALITSTSISAVYLPIVLLHWQGFSAEDLDKVMELMLYNVVAVILGALRDREKAREKEKLEAIVAMAGSVAHELNTPLFVLIGNAQLLQGEFETGSEHHQDAQAIIDSARKMKDTIEKIAHIDRIRFTDYVGSARIIDTEPTSS